MFSYIPEIEQTGSFGEVYIKDGVIYPMIWAEIVDKFHEYVYKIGLIVDFDWGSWTEGKTILTEKVEDFSHHSPVTLCKLLTTIVRADRFIDGKLVASFQDGTILNILRGLEKRYGKFC